MVFESLAAINEDDGDIIIELAAEFSVGVDIDFAPSEAAAT
jgi:hypothetical protein